MRFLVLCVALVLAGCAEAPVDDVVAPELPELFTDVVGDGNTTVSAPGWKIGDWHGHHTFLGNADTTGFHVNSVVVETNGQYLLAVDDQEFAKVEGAFDVPMAGVLNQDLSSEAFGGAWDIYDFPLSHGHTWAGTTHLDAFGEPRRDIEFEATFNPAIKTTTGTYPGFDILGTVAGVTIIETDYVPEIGWYSNFVYYNIMTEDPEDFEFRVISMGFGHNWTGTYYVGTGELATISDAAMYPDGDGVTVQADPHQSFQMRSEHEHLFGFAYAFAYSGASEIDIIAPDNTRTTVQAVNPASGFTFDALNVDLPAQAGTWRVVNGGAGVVAGAGAYLWSVIVDEGQL